MALSELPKNVNIGSKFDGINSLNDYIVDYYRRRFGGDLTSRPMSSPTNNSPHSFRRFSSTSIDQLTLKSKFQALQWKFRHQPPLTVITGGGPIRATPAPASVAATTSSASPSFRRKAGRLVDESFGFIDSELQKPRKKFIVNHNRPLHRTEMEIQLPHRRETESKKMTTNFQSKFNKNRAQTRTNDHLVEYSSNDGEIYAVYAKRDQNRADVNANSSRNRNVQFDDQIRVVERYHPDMQISTGGFVRQLCAIVKPHKRDKEYFNSSKLNIISAYSPSINVPKPNSSSGDLESSFYSAGKSCTLPSLPVDGTTSPLDMDMMTSSIGRDIYSADVDQASITENPAFRDEFQFNANGNNLAASGSRQLGSSQAQAKNVSKAVSNCSIFQFSR